MSQRLVGDSFVGVCPQALDIRCNPVRARRRVCSSQLKREEGGTVLGR